MFQTKFFTIERILTAFHLLAIRNISITEGVHVDQIALTFTLPGFIR